MEHFIGQADAVVGNLDESMDEGVVVELQHARSLGKPVVGWRTDAPSPAATLVQQASSLFLLAALHVYTLKKD